MDVKQKPHPYLILKQYRKGKSFTLTDTKAHYLCNIPHTSDPDISKKLNLQH